MAYTGSTGEGENIRRRGGEGEKVRRLGGRMVTT